MAAISNIELQAVDAFLTATKRLEGGPPEWRQAERLDDMTANWNVLDQMDVTSAQLRFRLSRRAREYPSVSLIFRGNSIWRLDLCPPDIMKFNPPWAAELGLPAAFSGSHCHTWADNRHYVSRSGTWKLAAHRPVEPALRRVEQMLPWFAERVGIQLEAEQRRFDAPPITSLFER